MTVRMVGFYALLLAAMMKDEVKNRLKEIVGAYDEKLAARERADTAKRLAKEAFPVRFQKLKTDTIRPTLEEFAQVLNAREHEAKVVEQEESSTTADGVKWAAIWLRIIPKPFAHKPTQANPSAIEITFSANRNDGKITVSSNNTMSNAAGSLGKRGSYEVDVVTSDVVAEQVLQALQEAFG
jgi:hypothetical protein